MEAIGVKILLFLLGIGIIIIGFFKPKEQHFVEEKVEKLIEEFTFQLSLENDEFIKKIKEGQKQLTANTNERITLLEERIERIEKTSRTEKPIPIMNPKYQEVIRLFQSGESTQQIAQKTNMGHGEVELVIELMKKGLTYA